MFDTTHIDAEFDAVTAAFTDAADDSTTAAGDADGAAADATEATAGPGDTLSLPADAEAFCFPDVYVGLRAGLLAPGDGVVTDRHHASADRYEPDDPQNQIGGQISPFALSGWLRHGCERVLIELGASACHPGAADGDYMHADVYERDLEAGYHEKGTCVQTEADTSPSPEAGCIIHDLFGGFGDKPGELLRRPVGFSPVRRQVDVTQGEAEAHYRQLSTHVRSRNAEDGGQPLRYATRDVVGNLSGTWHLTLRTVRPEFVGLLVAATEYLRAHNHEFSLQLGGARNFGAGIVDCELLNPLYSTRELRWVYDRAKNPTSTMDEKDATWRDCRAVFARALRARVASTNPADVDYEALLERGVTDTEGPYPVGDADAGETQGQDDAGEYPEVSE